MSNHARPVRRAQTRPAFTIMVGGVWILRFRMKNSPWGFLKCQKFWDKMMGKHCWWRFLYKYGFELKLQTIVDTIVLILMFIVFCYPSIFRNAILQVFVPECGDICFGCEWKERKLTPKRRPSAWTQMDPDIRYEWKMAWTTTGYSIQRRCLVFSLCLLKSTNT